MIILSNSTVTNTIDCIYKLQKIYIYNVQYMLHVHTSDHMPAGVYS